MAPTPVLFVVIVVSFSLLALPMALLAIVTECADNDFHLTWVMALAHLISFGEEGAVRNTDAPGCILMTTSFSLVAMLLQAAIFALCVTRFLNPHVELAMPTRPCVIKRNGRLYLSLRLMHPQGHLVSNISLNCLWIHPRTTAEGESYMAVDPILFNDNVHRHLWMPPTFLHALDSSSPLERHAADIKAAPGYLLLLVQGYDEVLKTSICNRARYVLAETAYGRWCDIITRSPNFPTGAGQPPLPWRPWSLHRSRVLSVDLKKFDCTVEEEHSTSDMSSASDNVAHDDQRSSRYSSVYLRAHSGDPAI